MAGQILTIPFILCLVIMLVMAAPRPQTYERNHVRIHVPVIKHTKHHTRTLVKKVPVPFPVPVPVHQKSEKHLREESFNWEKAFAGNPFY